MLSEKEKRAKEKLKEFADNHPIRKEQERVAAMEDALSRIIGWCAFLPEIEIVQEISRIAKEATGE